MILGFLGNQPTYKGICKEREREREREQLVWEGFVKSENEPLKIYLRAPSAIIPCFQTNFDNLFTVYCQELHKNQLHLYAWHFKIIS